MSSARLFCSRSAFARLAESRSVETLRVERAAAASTTFVKRASSASFDSGQRTRVTLMSRTTVIPESASESIIDVNQKAPKVGSVFPFSLNDIAARPVRTLPVSFSGCGW